jgi:hypothetical protein
VKVFTFMQNYSTAKRACRTAAMLIAAVTLACCLLGGCAPKIEKVIEPPAPAAKSAPPAEAPQPEKVTVSTKFQKAGISWDDDKGRRVLEAGFTEASAQEVNGDAQAELKGVKATLYKDGRPASILYAPTVTADSAKKEIKAGGGVKIVSKANNTSALCESVVWKSGESKLVGTGGVKLTMGNITISAAGFEADTALKKAKFSGAQANLE